MKITKEQVYVEIERDDDFNRWHKIFIDYPSSIKITNGKRYLVLFPTPDELFEPLKEHRIKVTMNELESLLNPKIKKSELKMEIEDLKEEVNNLRETLQALIDERNK